MPAYLITRGLLGSPSALLVDGFTFTIVVEATPADLYQAAAKAVLASASLQTSFGRARFVWIDLAPPSEPLPVAVISHVSADTQDEPAETPGGRTRVEQRTFQITVYDIDRDNATLLAENVADVIEAAAAAGTLLHDNGTTLDACRDGVELDSLEDDTDADGADVWGRVVQFEALTVRT